MEITTTSNPARAQGASTGEPRDQDLVGAILAGDEAAFALLMRRYNRRLFRLCRSVLRNEAEAEDALQEAYVAAFLKLDTLEDPSRIGGWLARIAWNESLSRLRSVARRPETEFLAGREDLGLAAIAPETAADQGDEMMMRSDTRRLLERAIDRLDEVFRPVFVLRGIEEMSVAETAEALGIPADTVKTRYFRARKALHRILVEDLRVSSRDVFPFAGRRCAALAERVAARVKTAGGPPFIDSRAGERSHGRNTKGET